MDISVTVDAPCIAGDNTSDDFTPDSRSLITLLCGSLAVLWKEWQKEMRCTLLAVSVAAGISLSIEYSRCLLS